MVYIGNLTHLLSEIIRQEQAGIFLASDDQPLSTTLLIRSIAEALNKKERLCSCKILKYVLRIFKPALYQRLYKDLFIDNTETRAHLQLVNPYTTQEGIKKMIIWYRARQK
jgi:nucleoside-diphosphate-sugar epimerase